MTVRVLFLAASPDDRAKLRLGEEVREIDGRLWETEHREIEVISKWAVRPGDLQRTLLRHKPHIVHFSGHGETQGIVVQGDDGKARTVPGHVLARIFEVFKDNVRVVIFNACHTAEYAQAVAKHVDAVIGMRAAVHDGTAVEFAGAFYMGIGDGCSVEKAFDIGITELAVQALRHRDQPVLVTRVGVSATDIILTGPEAAAVTPNAAKAIGQPPLTTCGKIDAARQRITAAEIPWSETLNDVTRCIENFTPVVVLAARQAGKSWFARQLIEHLSEHRPTWTVVRVSTCPLDDESVKAYLTRMRARMAIDEPCERLVVCLSGWPHRVERSGGALSKHLRALGNELRARIEQSRSFTPVAIGGYPLYLLRYSHGDLSALNLATQKMLPDLTAEQIRALMEQCQPGRWSLADAGEVCERSGGHPHLVKALLCAHVRDPGRGWAGAEQKLEDDGDFLLPTLAGAAKDPVARRALERCLERDDGIKWRPTSPLRPDNYLLYTGLLRRAGQRLQFRCDAVRRLVRQLLEKDEDADGQ